MISSPDIQSVNKVLHQVGVPLILWGDHAMQEYGIPTLAFREDILVPDAMLDAAASALRANGWTDSTGPLPIASAGFWMPGWEVVAAACRRFHHPGLESEPFASELLILPTSFVGLDPAPLLDTPYFTRHNDNIYCPSSRLMLTTVICTVLLHPNAESVLALMGAWMGYFYAYAGFGPTSLDDAKDEVKNYWQKEMRNC